MSFVEGNPVPIINNLIKNNNLKPGQQPSKYIQETLTKRQVWIKDVDYLDSDNQLKRCKSLDEYFNLPPKILSINTRPISRKTFCFSAGELAIFRYYILIFYLLI